MDERAGTANANQTTSADDGSPVHPRIGFDIQRRLLLALLVLSVVTSIGLLSVLGMTQWRDLSEQAEMSAERATTVAKEQADKVFELDAALIGRVEDAVTGMSEERIRRDEKIIHTKLRRMIAGLPQVIAVAVIGSTGNVLAHSRDFPVPAVSVADREYFTALSQGKDEWISTLMMGRRALLPLFTDGMARRLENGAFSGVILVSLDPQYFLSFYDGVLAGNAHQSLALVRSDGHILVRYPKMENAISMLPASSPFLRGVSANAMAGKLAGTSPLDGDQKIISYRRVANRDVYVVSAHSLSTSWTAWSEYMALAGALLLIPSAFLWGIIIFAIRRIKDQKIAWQHWRRELALRHKVESDLRESQKFEALGKLLGRVAHDFNNCLMVIATGMQIIRLKKIPGIEKQIDAVERSIKSGEQLTRQLLGVSRRQPLKPEVFSLQDKIPEWQMLLFNSIGADRCSVSIDPGTWPVHVDLVEMQLALLNVLVNARDASTPDGRIILKTENLLNRGGTTTPGYFVCVSVIDQGVGMSEETRKRAFDPLFTTKEAGKGTGLGLSQVENFAKTAGGYVLIESRIGAGTTVAIYIPAAEGAPLDEARDIAHQPSVAPLKLLLVEDNIDVAEGIVTLLETAGHAVTHLKNALEAEHFLAETRVDAVISDIHMPGGITGIALAKKLSIELPDLPVILVSGYAEDLQAAVNEGFRVIPKPFTVESINAQLAVRVK